MNSERIFPNISLFFTSQNSTTSSHYFNISLVSTKITINALIFPLIVVGNILCLFVFLRTKALRRRSYDLLINLSVADLMVGFSIILVCIDDGLNLIRGKRIPTFRIYCRILQYLSRMCSLFIIATVAIERLWAVGYPLKHRQAGKLPYAALISMPWLLSCFLASLYFTSLNGFDLVPIGLINYIDTALTELSLLTIVFSYCALICKIKQTNFNSTTRNNRNVIKERKMALTLFVVTLASIITIYPINIYIMIVYGKHVAFSETLFLLLNTLACCNSGINIIVYMLRINQFKRAICRIVWRGRQHTDNRVHPLPLLQAIDQS